MFVFATHRGPVWEHPLGRSLLRSRRIIVILTIVAFALVFVCITDTIPQRVAVVISAVIVFLVDWAFFWNFRPFWVKESVDPVWLSQTGESPYGHLETEPAVTIRVRLVGQRAELFEDLRHRLGETDYTKVVVLALSSLEREQQRRGLPSDPKM